MRRDLHRFHDDHFDRMSKSIATAHRFAGAIALVGTLVWFAVTGCILGFLGWVIVKVMQHFGII